MRRVQLKNVGGLYRVIESDGKPVMHGRLPVDGGGLHRSAAVKLVEDINNRRANIEHQQGDDR